MSGYPHRPSVTPCSYYPQLSMPLQQEQILHPIHLQQHLIPSTYASSEYLQQGGGQNLHRLLLGNQELEVVQSNPKPKMPKDVYYQMRP